MVVSIGQSSTGRTFVTGNASLIDSKALISSLVSTRQVPIQRLQDQADNNTKKIAALQELQSSAASLRSTLAALKSDFLGNVFDGKQVSYGSASASVSPSAVFTATANNYALAGNTAVEVVQLAKSFSAGSADQTSPTTDLNATGTFDIAQAGKTAATISIAPGDTMQSLRNKINATTLTSGVSADILQVSATQYRLIIRGADTSQAVNVTNITGDNVLQTLGATDAGGVFQNVIQAAQSAEVKINGITVTSTTNKISNVLTGVDINLLNAAPGTELTLTVGNNVTGVQDAIKKFVESYNSLKAKILANDKVDSSGNPDPNAYLRGEWVNSSLGQRLAQSLGGSYGSSSVQNSLRSVGISINASNDLEINSATLSAALNSGYDDVRSVFASSGSGVGFADTASDLINSYSKLGTGAIAQQIAALQETNLKLTQRVTEMNDRTAEYENNLIDKFAKMEAQMKRAESLKKQILAVLEGTKKEG